MLSFSIGPLALPAAPLLLLAAVWATAALARRRAGPARRAVGPGAAACRGLPGPPLGGARPAAGRAGRRPAARAWHPLPVHQPGRIGRERARLPAARRPARTAASKAFADAAETWNRRFDSDEVLFGAAPNAWLEAQAHHWPAGAQVLCVADGEGRNSVWLARQGLRVDACDIAEVGVAKARRLAADAGVTVHHTVGEGSGHRGRSALIGLVARRR